VPGRELGGRLPDALGFGGQRVTVQLSGGDRKVGKIRTCLRMARIVIIKRRLHDNRFQRRPQRMVVNAVADGATPSSWAARTAASRSAVGMRIDVLAVSVMSLPSS